jgi:methylase of polypeptide subunit release factors
MSEVDATAYLRAYPGRRVLRPLKLGLNEHSYPLEPWAENSWLAITFRAFARLARRERIRDLLIVGTGNGLDALGAIEIFDLRSLVVTDLFEASLACARENVLDHLNEETDLRVDFHSGDLLSCVPAKARFDLVYENLPNLPATAEIQLQRGTHSGRFFDATARSVPEPFSSHLLALHYLCLRQSWQHVTPGGGVLTAIGGRIPDDIAFALHRACGYAPELVAFDVKPQIEPELVLPAYRRAEDEQGLEFTFYATEAAEIVAERRRGGLDGRELADSVAGDLRPLAMSAREAAQRSQRGDQVAHSVLMILGRQPSPPRP